MAKSVETKTNKSKVIKATGLLFEELNVEEGKMVFSSMTEEGEVIYSDITFEQIKEHFLNQIVSFTFKRDSKFNKLEPNMRFDTVEDEDEDED